MAFLDKDDLKRSYEESKTEAHIWQQDYPAFERLMDNDLMEGMDENLPEVNDGSLAAALFKLPKRIVSSKLQGTAKAINRDEAWLSDLANLQWQNEIIPNANMQAPFHRKLKDSVRKAAGYGSVPLITLSVYRDGKTYTDFIVAQPQDVKLEAGKVSDLDSDVIYWDVYYTKLQVENMIEQAKAESKEKDSYNQWDVPALEAILLAKQTEDKSNQDRHDPDGAPKMNGFKFCIAFQRGKDAPFYMYHPGSNKTVREWTNPDPTGDMPVHYLYCYQDFKNPYGTGIVKLAGGTQNVLDYMRQADVLATQLGLRPPVALSGDTNLTDFESIVHAQDAVWEIGNAKLERQDLANGVYQQLPERMQMYKGSLNQLIPMGDTSVSAAAGDPLQSKTPAGVKLAAASLSIDDDDFKDNLYITYEAVAKSMINTHFANMEGSDLMKLSDDERDLLTKGGLVFPEGPDGPTNQLEVQWDTVRAEFNFEVDAELDKVKDDQIKLDGLTSVAELIAADPAVIADMQAAGKKFNKGELYAEMIRLSSDNDKIITDIGPEEMTDTGNPQEMQQQMQDIQAENEQLKQELAKAKAIPYKDAPETVKEQMEQENGYDRQGMVSPIEEALIQKEQQQAEAEAQSEHSRSMDVVREHNTPDPMEMAKLKNKESKPKATV